MTKARARFEKDGITQLRLYSISEYLQLRQFVFAWISQNFVKQGVNVKLPSNLSKYHNWVKDNHIPHEKLFSAPYRFTQPPSDISSILLNNKVFDTFEMFGLKTPKLIDEGMGWLGYRIIRPGLNDGYPLSAKNWGASQDAFSFWVPLFGLGSQYALHYVAGSHKKSYKNYLPESSKFTKDEKRLDPSENVRIDSELVIPGKALFYHPKTLHTENVSTGRKTRINLEFRFNFSN